LNELFGTDGVRGVANDFLTPELAFALGRAGAYVLARHGARRPLLVGRDTRLSGPMLEDALCSGVASVGLDVWKVGIVTTPAVAFLTRHVAAAAGVMISASHNPVEDNGIKFFAADGCKLADSLEDEIAVQVSAHRELPRPTGAAVGEILTRRRLVTAYLRLCVGLGESLRGMSVVVDGAYGAAYDIAPAVLRTLGARVIALHCKPNGNKINVECGSTDLSALQRAVAAHPGSIGVGFDGDADRALFVDEDGEVVDGDRVLAMLAREFKRRGELPKDTVVATVMSNLGLELALRDMQVELVRTAVGDRHVLEALRAGGYRLGGEQSGHIIDLAANSTGDGVITAVRVCALAAHTGSLRALRCVMRTYPQVLVNVRVANRAIVDDPSVRALVKEAEESLHGNGRVLVRASGTEPVIRIMMEGAVESQIRSYADHIAAKVAALSAQTERA